MREYYFGCDTSETPLVSYFRVAIRRKRQHARVNQVCHSHLSLKKIVPNCLELRTRCTENEDASSGTTVGAATATVHHLGVAVLRVTIRVYGDLQSKLRRLLSHVEASLGDAGQSQRLFGDEENAIPRYPREY